MKTYIIFLITSIIFLAEIAVCQSQMQITGRDRNISNLEISQPTTINISVCPGCQKTFDTESYCMEWLVTTNKSLQDFQVFFSNPSNASDLNLDWVWTFQDDFSGEWKEFNNSKNPTSANGHPNNIFTVESSSFQCLDVVRFRVCVTGLQASCAQTKGKIESGFSVTVSCYSGCDDDDYDDDDDDRDDSKDRKDK